MNDPTQQFYDDLAQEYDLLFADWDASVRRQAEVLDGMIRRYIGTWPVSVLDCTCGIGTQAIGLSLRGYAVHATDLSPTSLLRAQREADRLGARLSFGVADVRALAEQTPGQFDVVLSCDNALPHLVLEADQQRAAASMSAKLKPGGLLVISIRDYDALLEQKPRAEMPRVFDEVDGRRVIFQVWDWDRDEPTYTVHHFVVRQDADRWRTAHRTVRYRAVQREEMSGVLRAAGFDDIQWHFPAESGYYQPIVTARRSSGSAVTSGKRL